MGRILPDEKPEGSTSPLVDWEVTMLPLWLLFGAGMGFIGLLFRLILP